jgi:hypothetical protein
MLHFANGRTFAANAVHFDYVPALHLERNNRIFIPVRFGHIQTIAVLDTGAPFSVSHPHVAQALNLVPSEAEAAQRLEVAGLPTINGFLHLLPIEILVEQGENLLLDAMIFVPDQDSEALWLSRPSYLGLLGCLEALRFAIDFQTDTFYFSELSD